MERPLPSLPDLMDLTRSKPDQSALPGQVKIAKVSQMRIGAIESSDWSAGTHSAGGFSYKKSQFFKGLPY